MVLHIGWCLDFENSALYSKAEADKCKPAGVEFKCPNEWRSPTYVTTSSRRSSYFILKKKEKKKLFLFD